MGDATDPNESKISVDQGRNEHSVRPCQSENTTVFFFGDGSINRDIFWNYAWVCQLHCPVMGGFEESFLAYFFFLKYSLGSRVVILGYSWGVLKKLAVHLVICRMFRTRKKHQNTRGFSCQQKYDCHGILLNQNWDIPDTIIPSARKWHVILQAHCG